MNMRSGLFPTLFAGLLSACSILGPEARTGVVTNTPIATASSQPSASASASGVAVRTVLTPFGLNIRSGPSKTAQVVGGAPYGFQLTVLGGQAGWVNVQGSSTAGWIVDDPALSSPNRLQQYSSHGFTVLYRVNWGYQDVSDGASFLPQVTGPQKIQVHTATNVSSFNTGATTGFQFSSPAQVDVCGITSQLKLYDAMSATPGGPSHLQQLQLTIDSARAMEIDFFYADQGDVVVFNDFLNSFSFSDPGVCLGTATPTPTPSPT
jgi:hypothetical protein